MARFRHQGEQNRQRYRRAPIASGGVQPGTNAQWSSGASQAAKTERAAVWAPDILSHLRKDAPVYALIGAHFAATALLCWALGATHRFRPLLYIEFWLGILAQLALPVAALAGLGYFICSRDPRLMKKIALLKLPFTSERTIANVVMLLSICVFLGCFTNLKTMIPELGGFSSELLVAEFDRILHFGNDPWIYFSSIFWERNILATIEYNYGFIWLVILVALLFYYIFWEKCQKTRSRFLICFILNWALLGNLAALLVRCAGPAFYHHVTGDADRFSTIVERLASSRGDYSAASLQDYLWKVYNLNDTFMGSGISAFPSMHVAVTALVFFFLAERNWKLGLCAGFYLVVTLVSSVTLAWHYAIDGYFSIGASYLIHIAVKRAYAQRAPRQRPIAEF